jgi:hypothetical protein
MFLLEASIAVNNSKAIVRALQDAHTTRNLDNGEIRKEKVRGKAAILAIAVPVTLTPSAPFL